MSAADQAIEADIQAKGLTALMGYALKAKLVAGVTA